MPSGYMYSNCHWVCRRAKHIDIDLAKYIYIEYDYDHQHPQKNHLNSDNLENPKYTIKQRHENLYLPEHEYTKPTDFYFKNNSYTSSAKKDFESDNRLKAASPIQKLDFILPDSVNNSRDLIYEDKLESEGIKEAKSYLDWKDYYRLNVIHNFMDELECNRPSLCTTAVIGQSIEGRDLKVLKISNSHASNACVWIDAGIHAREWIGPAVNTYIANYIANNFDTLPGNCTNKDWYFLPVANPDGYEYSHTTERMWRKNRASNDRECFGVDLNRNFSYGWGGIRSSDQSNSAFYRGPHPFSEPESCAIRDLFSRLGLQFKVYITLHSYGQIILFPFGHRDALAPDYIQLLEGATIMSKAIFKTNGSIYKVGLSKDVMYGASGTSTDWSYAVAGIPFCYLIELRSKKHKFMLPKEEIEETGKEILNSVIALMELVDKYKIRNVNDGSDDSLCNSESEAYTDSSEVIAVKVAPVTYKTQVWEVKFANDGQRHFVKSLDTKGAINIWKEELSTMDIMVEGPKAGQVAGLLHEREIPYSIAMSDVLTMLEREQGGDISKTKRHSSNTGGDMDWNTYHRLDDIYAFMDNLAAEYPYLVKEKVIGRSVEGRELKIIIISNGEESNKGVWLDGSIHAREWISVAVVTYIAHQIVRNFHRHPESVTNKDWYILPVLNPDGYEYTHTHDRMWRKNRARYGECIGVDLNRNFSHGWGVKDEEGSSDDPGNIFYRGPKPFSEPETAAVKRTIMESSTEFKVFLSLHSYGEVVIFPWGYTSEPCPDYVELLEGGTAIVKAIHETNGHTYRVGSTKDLMYYAAGTSIDWSYGTAKIPYSYMFELRGKTHRFLLPKEEIVSTATEVLNGVLRLMDFVDRKCISMNSCVCPK